MIDKSWNVLINPIMFNENWFITHKHSFGNEIYLFKRIIIVVLPLMIIMGVLRVMTSYMPAFVFGMCFCIFLLTVAVRIWRRFVIQQFGTDLV